MLFSERDIDGVLRSSAGVDFHHGGLPYRGIMQDDYASADFGPVRISSNNPILLVKDPECVRTGMPAPALTDRDTITIEGKTEPYTLVAQKPNGQGLIECTLVEGT